MNATVDIHAPLAPPEKLTKAEAECWRRTVSAEPAMLFRTEAMRDMLANYCRHQALVEVVTGMIAAEMAAKEQGAAKISQLAKLRASEEAEARKCLTSLRMTNQSRVHKEKAGVHGARAAQSGGDKKPWE